MFRHDADPWDYARSPFEAFKRGELPRACGGRIFGRGLELACANGETSRPLARRCLRLLAVDASPRVVAEAKRRVPDPRNTFAVARLPEDTPPRPIDLIVASEILYYMPHCDMDDLLSRLAAVLTPGGRMVVLHHTLPSTTPPSRRAAPRPGCAARAWLSASLSPVLARQYGRFHVAAFIKPSR